MRHQNVEPFVREESFLGKLKNSSRIKPRTCRCTHRNKKTSNCRGVFANQFIHLVIITVIFFSASSSFVFSQGLETTVYVDAQTSESGDGSSNSPFKTIQEALNQQQGPGTILVRDGIYNETLGTVNGGTSDTDRIILKAENDYQVIVTNSGRVLRIFDPYISVEGFVFDGQMGDNDVVNVTSSGDHLVFRRNIVCNGARDGMDLGSNSTNISSGFNFLENVLIEDTEIFNMLWMDNGVRKDAHAIVAGGVKNFKIHHTKAYYVSGDALQLQDGGWDHVELENVHFWNGPLVNSIGGFAAGINPGENAIDTKQDTNIPYRGRLFVRNSEFNGWCGDLITNAAALNLKEQVTAVVDACLVYENEIGFRLRGRSGDTGAYVTVMNNVIYDNVKSIRYEDQIKNLHIYNNTFGNASTSQFQSAGGAGSGFEVFNNLFVNTNVPGAASDSSNLSVDESGFINAENHNYRLNANSPAVDGGAFLVDVLLDFDGNLRFCGAQMDVGAFEFDCDGGIDPPNQPPVVSEINLDKPDIDLERSGIQIWSDTTVIYSSSADDPDGDELTWEWLYSVNNGSEQSYLSGNGDVADVEFYYGPNSAGTNYNWILRVQDGEDTVQASVAVEIIEQESEMFTAPFLWEPIDLQNAVNLGFVPTQNPFSQAGPIQLVDATVEAGLSQAVAGGNQHGVGIAFVDVNGDGWEDIFIANGKRENSADQTDSMLFFNKQDGTFVNGTQNSGVQSILGGKDCYSVAAADYDHDGDIDLYVGTHPKDILLQNQGNGTFEDRSTESGAGGPDSDASLASDGRSKIVAFGDYNGDGFIDILCASSTLPDPHAYLLKNLGNGTFEDVTTTTGVQAKLAGNPCAVMWSDYDNDGDADIWIWNDRGGGARILLRNEQGVSFTDVTQASGVNSVNIGHPMGIDGGDIDHDGDLDYYISNNGNNPLLRNNNDGTFTDITQQAGTGGDFGWGLGFEDFNGDSWIDIFVAQEDNLPYLVFTNLGENPPKFSRSNFDHIQVNGSAAHNVAVAFADYNHDGLTDVVTGTTDGSRIMLYKNTSNLENHHWLELVIPEVPSTGEAGGIGARVVVKTGDVVQFRDITGGSSRASQNALTARFGLGSWTGADLVAVLWPSGEQIAVTGVAGNQRLSLGGSAPKDGLLAHYSFDGNANDQSGANNHGQVFGGSFVSGVSDQALELDGHNDYLAIQNLNFHPDQELEALSVSGWVRTTVSGGNWFGNWAIADFDRNEYFSVFVRGDDGRLGFSTTDSLGIVQDFYSNTSVNDGDWHFICAVYDKKDKILYIDGQEDSRKINAHQGLNLGSGSSVRYGFVGDGSEASEFNGIRNYYYYEGLIDELKIYSKPLSADDISAEFESIVIEPQNELLFYYSFDGNAEDSSGGNNHGEVHGPRLATGVFGQAYEFDGQNDYIAIENIHFDANNFLNALTVSSWVRTTSSGGTWLDNWSILDFDRNENFSVFVHGGDGRVGFSTTDSQGVVKDFFSNSSVNDGEWHFVCMVYTGWDKVIYIDGMEDARHINAHHGLPIGSGINPRFGFIGDGSEADEFNGNRNHFHYRGLLDELKLFKKALSGIDIVMEYQQISLPDSDDGLVLNYTFDGNTQDSSALGNHGMNHGAVFVPGKSGQALDFNGTSNYLAIENLNFTSESNLEALTACAWVNTIDHSGDAFSNWSIVDFDRNEYFSLFVRGDTGQVGFSTTDEFGNSSDFYGSKSVHDGEWHYVCAVYNGRDKIIYVDGQEDNRTGNAHNGLNLGAGQTTRYGFIGDGSEASEFDGMRNLIYYEGRIDEVELFTRDLSQLEIEIKYQSTIQSSFSQLSSSLFSNVNGEKDRSHLGSQDFHEPSWTIYEDAEDQTSARWEILNEGMVVNVSNGSLGSEFAIETIGAIESDYFRLALEDGSDWNNESEFLAEFSIALQESGKGAVYFQIATSQGIKYLVYADGDFVFEDNPTLSFIGLDDINDGEWHTITRNLESDLFDSFPEAEILAVKSMFVYGSLRIDNVRLREN